ncbi:MAG TPA: ABC transporter, partial [Dehalococcoidia bacterium]|nr:ABC transporter [Dehalococcoidia bacterium]
QYNEEEDFQGPLAVGVLTIGLSSESVEAGTEEVPEGTRLMVYGDSDFASNRRFQDGDNGNLFLSSVEMLGVGKELITMDRKYLQTRRLLIGPEVERFITISSIGLLPLLVLVAGAYIWWRRR